MKDKSDLIKEQNYKHYPFWDNIRYAAVQLRGKKGMGALAVMGTEAVLAAVSPFLTMALPSVVVYLLGSGWQPGVTLAALAGYVLALQGMRLLSGYLIRTGRKIRFSFRILFGPELFGACMDADYQMFESEAGQDKLKGAFRNIYSGNNEGIEAYVDAVKTAVTALLGLSVYSVIIGMQSLWILLLLACLTGISTAVRFYADRCSRKYDDKNMAEWKGFHYLCQEALESSNGKDIRIYHMWQWFSREFHKSMERLDHWGGKSRSCSANAGIADLFLSLLRDLAVYAYLIYQMVQGRIGLSAFLLYVGIVAGFSGRVTTLLNAVTGILSNARILDRYRDFVEFSEKNYCGDEMPDRPGQKHEIRLEHVSFRYEGSQEDTIHDLSLTIAPGEKIALVGMNGAGKSTLIKLICGLYRPTSGRIYLDGKDVSTISQKEYWKEFSVVFQDVFAFSFSLNDNVSCKGEDADEDRLRRSLEDAGLWERVQELDQKGQTYMNKDMDASGVSLSGGELQRLMLARALYKESRVVILDEPAAALDPIAEGRMYEKYYEMTMAKTSIFISHRLSSTRFCDRILFLSHGRITEEGSHDQLMERQGDYASMFHTQAQYYQNK